MSDPAGEPAPDPTDSFNVVVRGGVQTLLPNGSLILLSGTANYEVRGMSTNLGPVVDVIGYQNSGSPISADWTARSADTDQAAEPSSSAP